MVLRFVNLRNLLVENKKILIICISYIWQEVLYEVASVYKENLL